MRAMSAMSVRVAVRRGGASDPYRLDEASFQFVSLVLV